VLVIGLLVASLVGVVLVLPIGGADMPVVISLLNSLSGLAAAATGFALSNQLLIIAGHDRRGGRADPDPDHVRRDEPLAAQRADRRVRRRRGRRRARRVRHVVSADAESAAMVLEAAQSVIIVPGLRAGRRPGAERRPRRRRR
jgi:H+-translocating NAD(P) transhydrogenase subunit beta